MLDRDLKEFLLLLPLTASCPTFPFRARFLIYDTLLPIDIAIEGGGCHTGRGDRFKKKERKERTSEVTVRPEIMGDRSKTESG